MGFFLSPVAVLLLSTSVFGTSLNPYTSGNPFWGQSYSDLVYREGFGGSKRAKLLK